MFLILTANQKFWKTNEKAIFLGEWCKHYDQDYVWSSMDYQVLPYHWEDRGKLNKDTQYLHVLNEKYLKILADNLNRVNNTNYSARYWRIIVEPWLILFITILFDRYECIKKSYKNYPITDVFVANCKVEDWVPRETSQFIGWFVRDDANQYLCGEIIKFLKLPCTLINEALMPNLTMPVKVNSKEKIKRSLNKVSLFLSKWLPVKLVKYAFISTGMAFQDSVKVQWMLRQIPLFWTPDLTVPTVTVDFKLRQQFTFPNPANEFEALVNALLPNLLPLSFLEAYHLICVAAEKEFPVKAQVILTTTANDYDKFNVWLAKKAEQGAKIIITQHGGFYGSAKYTVCEEHEVAISDAYFTWGWHRAEKNVMPMPAQKLMHSIRNIKYNPNGGILYADTVTWHYACYLFVGWLIGPHMLAHIKDQHLFYKHLSPSVRDLLLIRLHPDRFYWGMPEQLQEIDPAIKLSNYTNNFYEELSTSRLFVSSNNSTTYLEALAANFPTILFWDAESWQMRPDAQPFFDELKQVGILHNTPESAAAKINEIYNDPLPWWNSAAVQQARKNFCYQFARTDENWLYQWRDQLIEIANKGNHENI